MGFWDDVGDFFGDVYHAGKDVVDWAIDISVAPVQWVRDEIFDFDIDMPTAPESPTYNTGDRVGNTTKEGQFVARCYGNCKIGGNKLRFNEGTDSDIRLILGHCMGEIDSITNYYVNDVEWSELTGTHTKTLYTGTRTQTPDGRFTSNASAYRSIAYTAFTFAKNDRQIGYDPNITVELVGKKCVPLAGGSHVTTRNPAVILYDWYLNVEGYSAGELDANAFASLEELCDEVPSGGTLPRYRFDFNFDSNMTINDAKKVIWASFNGRVIMSQGKLKPVWDSSQQADGAGSLETKTVSHQFTVDNMVKDSLTWNHLERPNTIRVHFKDSSKQYKTSSVEIKDEIDINTNGEILFEESDWFITDAELARRRAKFKYGKKRYPDYSTTFTALSGASDLEVLDLVTITHLLPGWDTKPFIITSRSEDSLGRMKFTAEAYFSGIYDDSEVGTQANFESTLPNPSETPTGSTAISAAMTAVGTAYDFDAVRISFTPPTTDNFYSHSEVYASNDDSTYFYVGNTDGSGTFTFSGLGVIYEPGDTCYIKIRSVSEYGVKEDLPASASTSVLVSSTMRLGGFYAGLTFFGDNATEANAKILLDKTNTAMRLGATSNPYLVMDGDYSGDPAVRSSNYITGINGAGFLLTSDLLEVGNIATRGMIRSAVFQKDVVSAVGGNLAVLPADVLATDMTALDASTLTTDGNETFAVNDILRIKGGTNDEWLLVTNIGSAPTYIVTRDQASLFTTNNNPAWLKGASVINYGQSGDGGVYMTSSETNAPYMSVFTHAGSPWSGLTTRARIGNLNGFLGYTTDEYGIAIGETDAHLKYDPTDGLQVKGSVTITGGSWSHTSDATTIDGGNINADSAITIGNTTSGNYCLIDEGDITFYQYINSAHYQVKSLKKIEVGTCENGEVTTLPGHWASTPKVMVSPSNLQTFAKDDSDYNQSIVCPSPIATETGSTGVFTFTPQAQLARTDGSASDTISGYSTSDYSGHTNQAHSTSATSEYTLPSNVLSIDVTVRGTGHVYYESLAPNDYYWMRMEVYVDYYIDGAWSGYISGGEKTMTYNNYQNWIINCPGDDTNSITKIRAYAAYDANDWEHNTTSGPDMLVYQWIELSAYEAELDSFDALADGFLNYIAVSE
jgi:hypothetical protein